VGETIYLVTAKYELAALHESGEQIWRVAAERIVAGMQSIEGLAPGDDRVYVRGRHAVACIASPKAEGVKRLTLSEPE
jgi:hypothetical protein